jgi:hypothetical protein
MADPATLQGEARTLPPAASRRVNAGSGWVAAQCCRCDLADRGEAGFRHLHVLRALAAGYPDRTDHAVTGPDRVAATEDHQPVDAAHRTCGQRRVVPDEVVPALGRQPKPTAV